MSVNLLNYLRYNIRNFCFGLEAASKDQQSFIPVGQFNRVLHCVHTNKYTQALSYPVLILEQNY